MTLALILRGILVGLQNICCRFLWKGNKHGRLSAWVKWVTIARPKNWEGWGIKRLNIFARPLATKLGWELITSKSFWTKVSYAKYIFPTNIMDWIRQNHRSNNNNSIIWKVVLNSISPIQEGLT